jgi:hypothetical protein
LRLKPGDSGLGVAAWSIVSLCLHAASATQHLSAESKLVGTWQLQTMTIESIRACTVGGPLIDTETRAADESRTIEVAGDAVIVTTRRVGLSSTDRYTLDGQARSFKWGDFGGNPPVVRTARWLTEGDGFELNETYSWGTQHRKHRWILSTEGQVLTIESTYDRQDPPSCRPGFVRIVYVFARAR